jgi:2-phospho-L-lactate/phosphoenolpyruvate guanylyltransferase
MWIIVPIKRFAHAKQRLALDLSGFARRRLAEAMANRTLEELSMSESVTRVSVASSELLIVEVARRFGFDVIPDPEPSGLNAAVAQALAHAHARGARDVGVVFSDLPLFNAADFDALVANHRAADDSHMTIVPDSKGEGTNVLLFRPLSALAPSYGMGSAIRYVDQARSTGISCNIVRSTAMAFDLDEPDDLSALTGHATGSVADQARILLRQISISSTKPALGDGQCA